MKIKIHIARSTVPAWLKTPAAAIAALALALTASAQQVVVPAPTIPVPETQVSGTIDTNQLPAGVEAPPELNATPASRQPFRAGPVTLRPQLSYQLTYGSGIQSSPGETRDSAISVISPGMIFDLGTKWTLAYTPAITIYSDSHFNNTVDQTISLNGRADYESWTFGLGQNCVLSSDPLAQTGQQTDQQLYSTSLKAVYQINGDVSLELGALQNIRNQSSSGNGGTNALVGTNVLSGGSSDWSTLDWLNFQWGPNLGAAFGAGFGYETAESSPNMTFEQMQGRVIWQVAHKVSLAVSGGMEIRQFLDSSASDIITPIMSVSINYQPLDVTTIVLSASRAVHPSYFENLVAESTSVSGSINQRFFKRFYLGLGGGYVNTDYHNSETGSSDRQDDYTFYTVSLGTAFLKRGNVSIYYAGSKNSSNEPGFSFTSHQVGLQLSYNY